MKTDRLLAIVLYLINRKRATARELAAHFEVSHRTIQRDMDSLALAGIPVYADRGREGGYRILDTCTVDRHYFAPQELASLLSLVGRLNTLLQPGHLRHTEEKLRNLVAPGDPLKKHRPLIMDFTPWGLDAGRRRLFQEVYRAVETSRVIRLRYAAPDGAVTERSIEPLSMILKGAGWYLYAFCRLRKALRFFKVTRIIEAEVLSEVFLPEVHPPWEETLETGETSRPTTLFVLRFSPSARGRITDYYHPDSLHFMPDGSIMGFFPFPEDEWVYSWIMSFGPLVEVLEPRHARTRIRDWASGLAAVYEKS
ncbi:YafY family protein [Desulfobotulus sp.]|jgi:predicted DNA-binding transcriptional regulator YafY|uniref:helix-turn-helix transcriptional regulator n=1 Tax=Desulfobotulus sp. TaxID=1940337 RepID=UPI002A358AB8|nr:YafY family protein [Desulfobotulus sp.]MDY0163399.1 YafY family protein [Desulfobotulus sp.]